MSRINCCSNISWRRSRFISGSWINSFTARVTRSELVGRLEALRAAISERKPIKEYQALARELYKQLLAPAESFIQGKELVIVPHGVLHNLPFHALIGADGRYLIEKYPIEYLSSASVMQFTRAKRRAIGKKVLHWGILVLAIRWRN